MTNFAHLHSYSIDELRAELLARQAQRTGSPEAQINEQLQGYDDHTIVAVLVEKQKVIYGVDDRKDLYEVEDEELLADADAVVALFQADQIEDLGDGTSRLLTKHYGQTVRLCTDEPFYNQPMGAFCSGFLVAPDLIATAGHCVSASTVTRTRFAFNYQMIDAENAQTVLSNDDVYAGVELVGFEYEGRGADWALVRLDRPVTNHRPVKFRRYGKVANGQALHVIGHPVGLPKKIAGGAIVRTKNHDGYFVANLDTYGGNSGSPVFNSETHEVEGILVRGERDFVQAGGCTVSLICPDTGCRGEDCTRATRFASYVPVQEPPEQPDEPVEKSGEDGDSNSGKR
jgi:hypothetical protein